MALCKECLTQIGEDYIINQHGKQFCTEDCLENWSEKLDEAFEHSDENHPYHFDYKTIRAEYLNWKANWKSDLEKGGNAYSKQSANGLLDNLDEIVGNYADYVRSEGDDGPFAHEIYLYTFKFRELQQEVLAWRPERAEFFGVCDQDMNYDDTLVEQIWSRLKEHFSDSEYKYLEERKHPYRGYFDLEFEWDDPELVEEMQRVVEPLEIKLCTHVSSQCDGGCGDYLDHDDGYWEDGWWICGSCVEKKSLGGMTKTQLEEDISYYEENPDELQKMLSRFDWKEYYQSAIRRACREHRVEVPVWAEKL